MPFQTQPWWPRGLWHYSQILVGSPVFKSHLRMYRRFLRSMQLGGLGSALDRRSHQGIRQYSPLPFPLFQSQVGHSLIRQVASPLSPKLNCMHRDVTRQCIGRWLSIKKAESYYRTFLNNYDVIDRKLKPLLQENEKNKRKRLQWRLLCYFYFSFVII